MYPTTHLLRPHQRNELINERRVIEHNLKQGVYQDAQTARKQLHSINETLEKQAPKPPAEDERDKMACREKTLREQIVEGMPSHEEMRKAPPGAVGKNIQWEKKNKERILEWKHIRMRLNHDSDDPDIANMERYRPTTSTLSMDNAFIPGQQFFLPPTSPEYAEGYDRIFKKSDTGNPPALPAQVTIPEGTASSDVNVLSPEVQKTLAARTKGESRPSSKPPEVIDRSTLKLPDKPAPGQRMAKTKEK